MIIKNTMDIGSSGPDKRFRGSKDMEDSKSVDKNEKKEKGDSF